MICIIVIRPASNQSVISFGMRGGVRDAAGNASVVHESCFTFISRCPAVLQSAAGGLNTLPGLVPLPLPISLSIFCFLPLSQVAYAAPRKTWGNLTGTEKHARIE